MKRPGSVTAPPQPGAKHDMTISTGLRATTRPQSPPDISAAQLRVDELEVRGVSFRGTAHEIFGEPRQDAFALASSDTWLVMVVSDGIGSCENSHHGSAAAAITVANAVESGSVDPQDGAEVLRLAAGGAVAAADLIPAPTGSVSATLTVAAVERIAQADGSRHAVLHVVGDSPAVLLNPADASWTYLTPTEDGPSNVVRSWVPDRHEDHTSFGITIPAGSILVLASDGFTTPLGDGNGPLGADLAARWATPRDLFPFMVDLSFNAYHDDKTVVAAWNPIPASADIQEPADELVDGETDV